MNKLKVTWLNWILSKDKGLNVIIISYIRNFFYIKKFILWPSKDKNSVLFELEPEPNIPAS